MTADEGCSIVPSWKRYFCFDGKMINCGDIGTIDRDVRFIAFRYRILRLKT